MSFQHPIGWDRAFPAHSDPPGVDKEEIPLEVTGKNQAHTRITSRTVTFSREPRLTDLNPALRVRIRGNLGITDLAPAGRVRDLHHPVNIHLAGNHPERRGGPLSCLLETGGTKHPGRFGFFSRPFLLTLLPVRGRPPATDDARL